MQIIKGAIHDEQPDSLVFWLTSVDVNTDIKEIEVEDQQTGEVSKKWQCDTSRYAKDEYIEVLQKTNDELSGQITDTQVALAEVYELIVQEV